MHAQGAATVVCQRRSAPCLCSRLLRCKLLVDFNASKCSNRDRTERLQQTLHKDFWFRMRLEPSARGDCNCDCRNTMKCVGMTAVRAWMKCFLILPLNIQFFLFLSSLHFSYVKVSHAKVKTRLLQPQLQKVGMKWFFFTLCQRLTNSLLK